MARKKKNFHPQKKNIIFVFLSVLSLLFLFSVFAYLSITQCANSKSCISNLSGNYETGVGVFEGKTVQSPALASDDDEIIPVLGASTSKKIYVDLTNQRLYAVDGVSLVHDFAISSGKHGWTPTGDFKIWYKVKYTRMSGGNQALGTYYDLPNVPYTMFFYNDEIPKSRGYGIHGAYWHNKFGQPMSHGCINLRPVDAEKLYKWADPSPLKNAMAVTDDMASPQIIIYGKYEG